MKKIYLTMAALTALFGAGRVSAQVQTPTGVGAQQDDDQAASELREHHRHHHYGGITQFIAMSLDTLGEDEAKRPQIEKLQQGLYACLASAGNAEKDVLTTIADGVDAGSIDANKVDSAIDHLGAVVADTRPCSTKALNKLHAILSPIERQTLVDKVQAHWQVWREVNHEAQTGGLTELTKELALTSDQVEKISTQLNGALTPAAGKFDPKKAEAHLQAFATAFTSKSFNAKLIKVNANGYLATHGAKRMALFYETVTPLLTPDQRSALAGHLREHAGQQPSNT